MSSPPEKSAVTELRFTNDHEQTQQHNEPMGGKRSPSLCRARSIVLVLIYLEQSWVDQAEKCKAK